MKYTERVHLYGVRTQSAERLLVMCMYISHWLVS